MPVTVLSLGSAFVTEDFPGNRDRHGPSHSPPARPAPGRDAGPGPAPVGRRSLELEVPSQARRRRPTPDGQSDAGSRPSDAGTRRDCQAVA
jgi:hypothetical protein